MAQMRTLRPVPDPLGSYLRPSRRDHRFLLQMLVEDRSIGTGLVADPCLGRRQRELLDEARRHGVETVLDPRTLELSSVGGFTRSGVAELPWAAEHPHVPADLSGSAGKAAISQIVAMVEKVGHTAVLRADPLLRHRAQRMARRRLRPDARTAPAARSLWAPRGADLLSTGGPLQAARRRRDPCSDVRRSGPPADRRSLAAGASVRHRFQRPTGTASLHGGMPHASCPRGAVGGRAQRHRGRRPARLRCRGRH